jgi:eukaryotic-like serine/threonine-protein kinase
VFAESISHYRLIRKVGSGGMGDVYLAEDTRLKRRAAIKVLPAESTSDSERVFRLQQEARAASSLSHPNIITIYDIGEDSGRHFIATEYIDGETLRERIDRGISIPEALDIAIQIGDAIAAAHEVEVIHRDIKPENIMVRRDGYVKVLDFGLAKLTDPDQSVVSRLTEPGRVMGTVQYMSPEQVLGYPLDERTDIFSLALILYEMLTRRQAFSGFTRADVVAGILGKDPEPVRTFLPAATADLDQVIAKALQKDRASRYGTAKELVADLKRLRMNMITGEFDRTEPKVSSGEVAAWESIGRTARAYSDQDTGSLRIHPKTQRAIVTVVVAILLAIAAISWVVFRRSSKIGSLAVIPFVNAGGPSEEYLSDGLTESLIQNLSHNPSLRVMARSTVYRYKGKQIDPIEIGRKLSVRAILTGRVVAARDGITIDTDLIDTSDGSQLWGEQYRFARSDIASIENEITREISQRLQLRLSETQRERLAQSSRTNSAAFELYLRGRYFWNKRTTEDFWRAIGFFNQATDQDPNFAAAYAGLADCYNLLGSYGAIRPRDAFPRARAAAMRALQLDPNLAEAHTSLAYALQNFYWDWEQAEREYQRAMELNPSYATNLHWYGGFLMLMGRFDEAIRLREQARDLDPLSPSINASLGSPHLLARNYERAIEHYRRSAMLEPNFAQPHLSLGWAFLGKGQIDDAITEFEKGVSLSKNDPNFSSELGFAYAVAGRRREAEAIADRLIAERSKRYVSEFEIAIIYIGLGEKDAAFQWLEQAYAERSNRLTGIKVEPSVDRIRDDPRFRELLRRMRLDGDPFLNRG